VKWLVQLNRNRITNTTSV